MRTEFNSNIEARPSLFKRAHKEIGMSHAFWVSLYIQDKMQNVGQYLILFVNQPNTDLIVFKSYPSNLYTTYYLFSTFSQDCMVKNVNLSECIRGQRRQIMSEIGDAPPSYQRYVLRKSVMYA